MRFSRFHIHALNIHPSPCHKSSPICPLMKAKQTNFIFLSPSSFPFFLLFYFLPPSPPSRGSVKGHRGLQLSVCAEELFSRQQFSQQRCNYEILPKHIGYYWMCHFWILAKGFGRNRTREEKREKNYAHVSLSILLLNYKPHVSFVAVHSRKEQLQNTCFRAEILSWGFWKLAAKAI